MKLNYKSFLVATTLMVVGANANANMVWDLYAGGTAGLGGMAVSTDKIDRTNWSAQSYGAVLGVDLPVIRVEAEYDYLKSDEINMNMLMGNAYVKFLGAAIVNPYIGVGVGMMVDAETDHDIDIDPTVAYQGMLGLTFNIPAIPFKIDLEGRALFMPDLFKVGDEDVSVLHYDGRIKLRYVF